jgi:hypothetical protein
MLVAVVSVGRVVAMEKLADVAPAGTITLVGVVALADELVSATTAPPVGAAASRYTVPRTGSPPSTLIGSIRNPFSLTRELNGARPEGKGRYSGSPVLRFIHFNH